MKIMVLSDTESRSLWDFFEKSKLEGIDLILSCGDLNPEIPVLSLLLYEGTHPVCPRKS